MNPPAVYNPCPSRELLQAKRPIVNGPPEYYRNRQAIVQPKIGPTTTLPKGLPIHCTKPSNIYTIQRHPMQISIGGQTRTTDTDRFLAEWEITTRLPHDARTMTVTGIHVRKESGGDHQ